ncbi:unnamed protein product [Toxocara canis]|uniref:Protein kinase domain-containing protein n=1 Tax=Toxocara canis TaxID=6265 RepID=A0A183UQ08_TOXCA|nr:unnamed protein product [Toxocara canis]
MREIVAAVVYIHEVAGILHRDLKPGNILIGLKNRIKLADFGLAVRVSELPRVSRALSGTPNYMSPEVLDGNGHSKESEAWALGCVFYCMLVGKPPFETDSLERTYSRIRSCSYFIPPEDRISERARVLIHRLLDPDVGRRLKVVDILDCDYFSREKAVKWGHDASMACSYQAGVHSRESGMDLDRMRSPKPDEPMLLLNLFMSGQISVLDEPSRVVNEHIVMVNKWVDYTNTYGFGCVLSDGTECVQFVDGSSCAHSALSDLRFATRYTAERWQLVINTNERPPTVYEWTSVSDVSDPVVIRKIELANLFRHALENLCVAYMHRELQSASPFAVVMPYMNYLVYQRRSNGALVMVLSDGITQINLLETHEKLVLRFEESGEVSVVVVHPEREMRIYRVSTKAFVPTAVDNRCVHDLITEARCRLVDHSNRPYYATEC